MAPISPSLPDDAWLLILVRPFVFCANIERALALGKVAIDFLPGLLYYLITTKETIMRGKVKNKGGRNKQIGGNQDIINRRISGGSSTRPAYIFLTTRQ